MDTSAIKWGVYEFAFRCDYEEEKPDHLAVCFDKGWKHRT